MLAGDTKKNGLMDRMEIQTHDIGALIKSSYNSFWNIILGVNVGWMSCTRERHLLKLIWLIQYNETLQLKDISTHHSISDVDISFLPRLADPYAFSSSSVQSQLFDNP